MGQKEKALNFTIKLLVGSTLKASLVNTVNSRTARDM